MKVIALNALKDNYIWVLYNQRSSHCVVVDPGDAEVVRAFLQQHKLNLSAILITHHHNDHIGGVASLCKEYPCYVYGPLDARIPHITHVVEDGDILIFNALEMKFQVMAMPGHTDSHVVYYSPEISVLLSGDTMFGAGCGKIFEGSYQRLQQALAKIGQLPNNTLIYCSHEYTLENLDFAKIVEVNNPNILQRSYIVKMLRQLNLPTIPSSLALEKATNPFLRCDLKYLQQVVAQYSGKEKLDTLETFTALYDWHQKWMKNSL